LKDLWSFQDTFLTGMDIDMALNSFGFRRRTSQPEKTREEPGRLRIWKHLSTVVLNFDPESPDHLETASWLFIGKALNLAGGRFFSGK